MLLLASVIQMLPTKG